ncbi:AMP-dependent synthetase/ligase [Aureibacter tunicatorum]|uniref:Long-chain acyl-CoA synthetase n=1 Tax=Aureibacter tunicatorum TaxID=866807 RepID=A0AAE3XJW1_9BACT|nr:long-chain fatty acid--CoA ligase [Aureibacter tunicatorum]MDR6239121.1 long-chain acyl-CoA synthetase [Aureibacter tunicatorum]BDD04953.1 long-chain-fatty-acid--CoA ligase [Aureibacter tunicatorum]
MDYLPLALLIRERVEKYKDKDALRYKDGEEWSALTWTEFGDRIDRLSKALLKSGVAEGEKVAIFSQNMPEWTITDFSALSVKAVPVPIYATNTAGQADYILNDAEIRFVFVGEQEQYEKAFQLVATNSRIEKIIVFDKSVKLYQSSHSIYLEDFINDDFDESLEVELKRRLDLIVGSDLATLIYTSGTTGEPKGVMLDNDNVLTQLKSHDDLLEVDDSDVSMAFLPLSHIFERAWTYYALHKGMEVAYLSNPKSVADAIKEVQPTIVCTVPRFYEKIYNLIYTKLESAPNMKKKLFNWAVSVGKKHFEFKRKDIPAPWLLQTKYELADKLVFSKIRANLGGKIKMSPCGGARLSDDINLFFNAIGVNVKLGYGLTETVATVATFKGNSFIAGTVGKPLAGIEIKIAENDEILVKGGNVMKGYYNKPEKTNEVFTDDGWFRTGDAGKIDAEGNLIITERLKDLMKTSGGKYIAPQQIETTIGNDHYIEQIAVIGDDRKYVTALIVPAFEALKEYAEQRNIKFDNVKDIVNDKRIIDFFKERIDKLQIELARFEQIKKFTLLSEEFTIERGEITPTLKIKRKVILQRYHDLIDKMYIEV